MSPPVEGTATTRQTNDVASPPHSTICGPDTLGGILARLFPLQGARSDTEAANLPYVAFPGPDGNDPSSYATPPILPPDVFAIAAHVMELSGAYHHVTPLTTGRPTRSDRLLTVTKADIAEVRRVAAAWRAFAPHIHFDAADPTRFAGWLESPEGQPMLALFRWWKESFGDASTAMQPVFAFPPSPSAPAWWRPVLNLMMAADEAASGIGYRVRLPGLDQTSDEDVQPWVIREPTVNIAEMFRAALAADASNGLITFQGTATLSSALPDVLAVLPKARTAALGCTLRSLSHHLALLPPRGVAQASWTPFLFGELPPDEQHMNLLLIPFPFSVPPHAFKQHGHGGGDEKSGFFEVEQTWLKDVTPHKMVEFVEALAKEAKKECDGIHGIVFPEFALDDATCRELARRLPEILPEIELLVAGVSRDDNGRDRDGTGRGGNFVSVTVYQEAPDGSGRKLGLASRREKHHRWRLDRYQILDYGLEGILSPSLSWWEDIDLLSRRVDFAVVRSGSVVSALICEDLARVDPCQEILRAVGPSIVFALLMDAPQIKVRWPARYATVLAEDPGSAVLTLTSRALMTRQQRTGRHPSDGGADRVVALWRDDTVGPREIACPVSAQGVRLTLSGQRVTDATIDGRADDTAVSWRHASDKPVSVPDVASRFADILGSDDLSLQGGPDSRSAS